MVMCYSLYKGLKEDHEQMEEKKSEKQMKNYEEIVSEIVQKRNVKNENKTNQ